ncbi:exodeoxyribonuclease VII large subunit [Neptunicoccus sediminis]|uniref:exodeoxyribonuclease VII large subunit n=1 Tax=Neptunicoccus sediminis TaxID=1892596 RepID=UPI000845EFBC|nr:exodeoxyribonuclease VII large subunit [Neptunicoccus sediminis]
MSDLIDDPEPGQNAPEFSVSEISGAVKRTIEGRFSHVRVRGEIGRVNRYGSGHIYYDLKDDGAVLNAVTWKGQAGRLSVQPEEGMEVVAVGKLTSFPKQSKYQMNVMELRVAGVGALMAMLEKRKKALAAEGLFDSGRKRPIPYLPGVIGVVTSPSGAVIRDILHRLRDRFPRKVLIWPVAVQGDRCAPEVAAAIEGFNRMAPGGAMPRPDLLIVARGGGSIEDLWGFNEESVVRAAAASKIPLISAVGHETDTTLIDYASDQRAPTPTAAAELAVPVRGELMAWLASMEERRVRALSDGLARRQQRLRDLSRALPNPADLVAMQAQRLDLMGSRLPRALQAVTERGRARLVEQGAGLRPQVLQRAVESKRERLENIERRFVRAAQTQGRDWRSRLDGLERLRETLGYQATLERGYAVVRDGAGGLVSDAATAASHAGLEIQFRDGVVPVASEGAAPAPAAAKPAKRKAAKKDTSAGGGEQGSLF